MLLVYDHDNVLHITNERGLRWNYDKADKPSFGFDYDFIFYVPFDDSFEYELNRKVEKLSALSLLADTTKNFNCGFILSFHTT